MITQERLKELLNYDPKTGLFIWMNSGKGIKYAGMVAGNKNNRGYITIRIDRKGYLAHRLVFLYMENRFPADQVDHINHNGLDNKWLNLREVSNKENKKNVSLHISNTSGVSGVSKNKAYNKWVAYIKKDNLPINLGIHCDWFEAVCARKSAENKYCFHDNHGLVRHR